MTTQPEALRLADELDDEIRRTVQLDMMHHNAAAELRRLHAENKRLSWDSIHTCHSECQRPLCRLTRQRDALLEALQALYDEQQGPPLIRHQAAWEAAMEKARAAIKAVEGEKT